MQIEMHLVLFASNDVENNFVLSTYASHTTDDGNTNCNLNLEMYVDIW